MALIHDLPESISSDIPTTVKREDPNMKKAIDNLEERVLLRLTSILPAYMSKQIIEKYGLTKETDAVEGKVLRLADALEAGIYAKCESEMGNTNMKEVLKNSLRWIEEFRNEGGNIIDAFAKVVKE